MAGDWIKMRGGLISSPKLIAMSRKLHENKLFREWLTPGGSGEMVGQIISDHALRCVTGSLLCVTWSWSREYGKALPNGDCLLSKITISDLDGISSAPGVGHAMEHVGWAQYSEELGGVILPKFFIDHNVPLTQAERQKEYRKRKTQEKSVTKTLRTKRHFCATREEKRRVEKNNNNTIPPLAPLSNSQDNSPETRQKDTEFSNSPEGLAQEFCFLHRGTIPNERNPSLVAQMFSELIRLGTTPEEIQTRLRDKSRSRLETSREFCRHFQKPPPTSNGHGETFDQRRARVLGGMRQ